MVELPQVDTAAVRTGFTIAADSGSSDTVSGGETLTFAGDTGITTTVSNNNITIDLDNTVLQQVHMVVQQQYQHPQ